MAHLYGRQKSLEDTASDHVAAGGSPTLPISTNESDATRRLIQCCLYGTASCDVSPRIKGAHTMPDSSTKETLLEMKEVILGMERQCKSSNEMKEYGWIPVLHLWELHFSESHSMVDLGNLLWASKDMKNFLMVEMNDSIRGRPTFIDYNDRLTRQAQKLFNLLHCLPLPNGLGFVRATYAMDGVRDWSDDFLSGIATGSTRPAPTKSTEPPPIIHLSSKSQLVPAFHERNIKAINSYLRYAKKPPIDETTKNLVLATPGQEITVPFIPKHLPREMLFVMPKECGKCRGMFDRAKLQKCGGCYLAMYCSPACQTAHWKTHKVLCKYGVTK